jgi:hypothetical protein
MKNLILECKAKLALEQSANESSNPSGKIEAQVTTWGAREGADGRRFNYQPEGFMEWAKEFADAGKPMPMFLNHNDMGMPMGEWTDFTFTPEGMNATGRLFLTTQGGSDLYSVLKESPDLFGGVSVGAYAEDYSYVDENGEPVPADQMEDAYFQITKGGLREVSVVMYPNNPAAEIQKLECFNAEGQMNPRQVEEILREAGVPKKYATTASSVFKKILTQRDANEASLKVTPNQGEPEAVVNAEDILKALEMRELSKELSKRIK